jgi:hypothetical protein
VQAVVAVGRRYLPRGWADLVRQFVIWFGFLFAYQIVRGLADRNPAKAFENGYRVFELERRLTNHVWELTAQRAADSSGWLLTAAQWTYWNSEFTVVGLGLLWVYLRRHESFARFRNTILLANMLGLLGYAVMPTAPPRMFPMWGFLDSLSSTGALNHGNSFVQLAANPYAAMPSLHAADALIVGLVLASVVRNRVGKVLWLLWPAWVWFCVMATANHYWLDCLAGIAVAVLAVAIVHRVSAVRAVRAARAD